MGPEFGNQMMMYGGAAMIIIGTIMYFTFAVFRDLRDSDPLYAAAPDVAIATGLACLLNGLVSGYHHKMSSLEVNTLSVLMIGCFIWCIYTVGKLIKVVHGKHNHT